MCRKLLGPEAPLSKKIWIESYPSKIRWTDWEKKEHIHQLWTLIFRISRRTISLHVWLWSWRATLTFPKTACRWELKCCKLILNGLWEISIIHTISWKFQRLEQQFAMATILLPNFPIEWKGSRILSVLCKEREVLLELKKISNKK